MFIIAAFIVSVSNAVLLQAASRVLDLIVTPLDVQVTESKLLHFVISAFIVSVAASNVVILLVASFVLGSFL